MNTTDQDLPELSDDAMRRIEAGVFSEITREKVADHERSRKRRRWVGGGLTAAAVIAAAVVITPLAMDQLRNGGMGDASDAGGAASAPEMSDGAESAGDDALVSDGSAPVAAEEAESGEADVADDDRRVIRNGYVTVVVGDVLAATDQLTALATEHGGFVESLGSSTDDYREYSEDEVAASEIRHGWATLRIPAEDLDGVRSALGEIGEVTSTEISENDVTSQAIDLEARIDATRTSVERLTDLMEQAGSVGELLDAEAALSERQAQLESYERELDHLDDQVAMSTLHVELTRDREVASTDPAGFGDGLLTGWNGLIGFANALVIAVGFLLPWLGVLLVAGVVVWLIVRVARRKA
ncbi:DUF4349 domain-containing protein [Microbacterium karelineae]|uniref:DUF4349 domain-containing protein n=1 Tax=Microbacterium karelineae TaxID=2654283 RepID=UPI0012EA721B|nr:DUF4349 domain-containing protein [Microbacterium karelineae]